MHKLLQGLGVSPGQASGRVKIISQPNDRERFASGDVLVTRITDPTMVTLMGQASAIVTDIGGITSHPAIVSREMGIPCVVATQTASKTLRDGQYVLVDGKTGEIFEKLEPLVPTRVQANHTVSESKTFADPIDEYLASARQGLLKMDLGTLQPFDFVEMDPLFADTWMPWLLHLIEKTETSGLSPQEITSLWHNPSTLRDVMIFDFFMAKLAPLTKEQRLKIARFYTKILKHWCLEDPFAFQKNIIHAPADISAFSKDLKSATPDGARALGRLASSGYHLSYGLFCELNPQIVYENYGPYDVSQQFDPGHIMVIKEFRNLKPTDLWDGLEEFPYTDVRIVSIYRDVHFEIDAITHTNYEGDVINNLVKYSVEVNGLPCDIGAVPSVTDRINRQAEIMWQRLTSLPFEELKIKYAHQKAYNYIRLCQRLGIDWKPPRATLEAIKNKPLVKPWPKFAGREAAVDHLIHIMDPRT